MLERKAARNRFSLSNNNDAIETTNFSPNLKKIDPIGSSRKRKIESVYILLREVKKREIETEGARFLFFFETTFMKNVPTPRPTPLPPVGVHPRRRRVRVSKRSGEKLSDDGTEFCPSPSAQPRPAPSPFPAHPTRTQAFPCPGHFREQRRLSTHLREIDQPSSPLPLPVCPGRKN